MMNAPEIFGCITPAIAKFMPWDPPSWSEYVARCETRVQAPEPSRFSFVIRRLDNRKCLGMAKTRILFRPNSAFGSRKALTGRVLAGKSWPHLLSGTRNSRQRRRLLTPIDLMFQGIRLAECYLSQPSDAAHACNLVVELICDRGQRPR